MDKLLSEEIGNMVNQGIINTHGVQRHLRRYVLEKFPGLSANKENRRLYPTVDQILSHMNIANMTSGCCK